MKIRAAVLREMGRAAPYAQSRPVEIAEIDLDPPGFGEVLVNGKGETSVPGLYAAGDVTNSAFKQIIISMGSGATAALGAYEYLMLHAQQRQAA